MSVHASRDRTINIDFPRNQRQRETDAGGTNGYSSRRGHGGGGHGGGRGRGGRSRGGGHHSRNAAAAFERVDDRDFLRRSQLQHCVPPEAVPQHTSVQPHAPTPPPAAAVAPVVERGFVRNTEEFPSLDGAKPATQLLLNKKQQERVEKQKAGIKKGGNLISDWNRGPASGGNLDQDFPALGGAVAPEASIFLKAKAPVFGPKKQPQQPAARRGFGAFNSSSTSDFPSLPSNSVPKWKTSSVMTRKPAPVAARDPAPVVPRSSSYVTRPQASTSSNKNKTKKSTSSAHWLAENQDWNVTVDDGPQSGSGLTSVSRNVMSQDSFSPREHQSNVRLVQALVETTATSTQRSQRQQKYKPSGASDFPSLPGSSSAIAPPPGFAPIGQAGRSATAASPFGSARPVPGFNNLVGNGTSKKGKKKAGVAGLCFLI